MQTLEKNAKEVEKKLKEVIDQYNLSPKISVSKVKEWVGSEVGESDPKKAFEKYVATWSGHLPQIKDLEEMNQVFKTFIDAWNYFPHKSLNNKAPVELKNKTIEAELLPKRKKSTQPTPSNASEALAMEFLKEVFKKQEPFIEWVYDEVLPQYDEYLTHAYTTPKVRGRHMAVATIFLDRAIRLGFEDYEEIPRRFMGDIFPRFWEETIFPEPLTKRQVVKSLQGLVTFVYHSFYRFPGRVGDRLDTSCNFASLDRLLPGIAEAERREIEIKGIKYTLLEQYCIDTFCDCRKAVFSMVDQKEKKVVATVGIQWNNKLGKDGKEGIRFFLEATGDQTSRAGELLKEIEKLFLADKRYIDTLQNHYLMFKKSI